MAGGWFGPAEAIGNISTLRNRRRLR